MVSPNFPKTPRKTQADQQPGQPHRAGVAEIWKENQMKNGSMFEYGNIYIYLLVYVYFVIIRHICMVICIYIYYVYVW